MSVNHVAMRNPSNIAITPDHYIGLDPLPGSVSTADIQATDDHLESSGGEVEAVGAASGAAVDNLHVSGTGSASDADHAAARGLGVEDTGVNGGNHITLAVGPAAGSEAGGEVGCGAGLALLEGRAWGRESDREESKGDDLGEHDCG